MCVLRTLASPPELFRPSAGAGGEGLLGNLRSGKRRLKSQITRAEEREEEGLQLFLFFSPHSVPNCVWMCKAGHIHPTPVQLELMLNILCQDLNINVAVCVCVGVVIINKSYLKPSSLDCKWIANSLLIFFLFGSIPTLFLTAV